MHRSGPRRPEGSSAGSKNSQCKGPEATELCAFQDSEARMAGESEQKAVAGHELGETDRRLRERLGTKLSLAAE